MTDAFERLVALQRTTDCRAATEVRATPLGTALFSPDTPSGYDSNALIARPEGLTAPVLAEHLDELYAGFGHRKAYIYDDATGRALAPGMRALGYAAERDMVLALRGAPPAVEGPAEEVEREACSEVERRGMEEDGMAADVVEQILRMRGRMADAVPTRFFVAEGAAHARLVRLGDLASITDVATLRSARGRGLARSIIALATHVALVDGARDVVLVTDSADWVQGFYRRLGFDHEAGAYWAFTATGR